MILPDVATLPNLGKHLALSPHAISSQSTDLTQENDQKPLFWRFGSFKYAFLWYFFHIFDYFEFLVLLTQLPGKSKQPNSMKAKNLFFSSLDHSNMHFFDFWMMFHDLVPLPKVKKHLVPSKYALSSRSNRENSRKWPKTFILGLWTIQKCFFLIFEWSFTTW